MEDPKKPQGEQPVSDGTLEAATGGIELCDGGEFYAWCPECGAFDPHAKFVYFQEGRFGPEAGYGLLGRCPKCHRSFRDDETSPWSQME